MTKALLLLFTILFANTDYCLAEEKFNAKENDVASLRVDQLSEWVKTMPNGYLSQKLYVGRADPFDPTSYFGVFAQEDLKKGEFLMRIPQKAKIQLDETTDWYCDGLCDLAWLLQAELEKGSDSLFRPYMDYLREQKIGQLPATWSVEGKELLLKVQGSLKMMDYEYEAVPGDVSLT